MPESTDTEPNAMKAVCLTNVRRLTYDLSILFSYFAFRNRYFIASLISSTNFATLTFGSPFPNVSMGI